MLGSNVHLNKRTIRATRIVIILIFLEAICWGVEKYTREIGYLTFYSTLFASLLLIYYLSLYVLTAKEDTLTHLLNRQCYYSDSERQKDMITAVVSVDMNNTYIIREAVPVEGVKRKLAMSKDSQNSIVLIALENEQIIARAELEG